MNILYDILYIFVRCGNVHLPSGVELPTRQLSVVSAGSNLL